MSYIFNSFRINIVYKPHAILTSILIYDGNGVCLPFSRGKYSSRPNYVAVQVSRAIFDEEITFLKIAPRTVCLSFPHPPLASPPSWRTAVTANKPVVIKTYTVNYDAIRNSNVPACFGRYELEFIRIL